MNKILIYIFILFQTSVFSQKNNKIIIPQETLTEITEMFNNDQKYRLYLSKSKHKHSISYRDSLWALQTKIDYYNTKRLIQLIKKYGYFDSSNSNSRAPIYAMLMHTPKKLKKEVYNLIDIQYKKGRIDNASYGMITWHLKGRPRPILDFK